MIIINCRIPKEPARRKQCTATTMRGEKYMYVKKYTYYHDQTIDKKINQ